MRESRENGAAGSKKRSCTLQRDVVDVNEELLPSSSALHQIRADTNKSAGLMGSRSCCRRIAGPLFYGYLVPWLRSQA
jgi:hypothetical protein